MSPTSFCACNRGRDLRLPFTSAALSLQKAAIMVTPAPPTPPPGRLTVSLTSNLARTRETCKDLLLFCPGEGAVGEESPSPHVIGDLLDPGALCFHQLQQQHISSPPPRPRRPTTALSSPSGFHWRPGSLPSSSTCGGRDERSRVVSHGGDGVGGKRDL